MRYDGVIERYSINNYMNVCVCVFTVNCRVNNNFIAITQYNKMNSKGITDSLMSKCHF